MTGPFQPRCPTSDDRRSIPSSRRRGRCAPIDPGHAKAGILLVFLASSDSAAASSLRSFRPGRCSSVFVTSTGLRRAYRAGIAPACRYQIHGLDVGHKALAHARRMTLDGHPFASAVAHDHGGLNLGDRCGCDRLGEFDEELAHGAPERRLYRGPGRALGKSRHASWSSERSAASSAPPRPAGREETGRS